jgi:hypothetical protein
VTEAIGPAVSGAATQASSDSFLDLKDLTLMRLAHWFSIFAFLLAALPVTCVGEGSERASREEARKAIESGNVEWGKARVAIDKNAYEKMLAPTLYVQVGDRRLTRQQFIDRISSYPPGVKLTRFDARVLTVMPNGNDWVAIIFETLEFERKDSRGKTEKEHWVWVTRDGWRKVSGDQWVILYSEEISHEKGNATPSALAN